MSNTYFKCFFKDGLFLNKTENNINETLTQSTIGWVIISVHANNCTFIFFVEIETTKHVVSPWHVT